MALVDKLASYPSQNRLHGTDVTLEDILQGSMFEFYAALEYRVLRHLAFGAAYDRLIARLDSSSAPIFLRISNQLINHRTSVVNRLNPWRSDPACSRYLVRKSDTIMKTPTMNTTRIPNLMVGVLSLTCCCVLSGNAALAQEQAPQKAAGETLTIDLAKVQKPWTGDLDGMIERRVIRVLTVNSKTFYFLDKGVLRGTAVDYVRLFEEELNKKLAAEKKLKNKNLKVRVVFIPVRRDQLLPGLAAGKGDIAAANLTITPERQKLVDFTAAGHEQRERGRGVGARFTESRQPGRSLRQGSVRAQIVELLREPRGAQPEVCGGKEAAGDAQGSPRDAGGRGSDRDARRRPHSAHHREQAHGGLLEADLPAAHRARRRRGSHRRRDRVGDPQGQPAAQGGAGRFRDAPQGRDLDRQPAPDALPEERQVREERGLRGRSARSSWR